MKKPLIALLFSAFYAIAGADGPPPLPGEAPPPLPAVQAGAELPPPLPGKEATGDQPPPLPPAEEPVPEDESATPVPTWAGTPTERLEAALDRCPEKPVWAMNWPFLALSAGCSIQYPPTWTPHREGWVLWIDGPDSGYAMVEMLVPGNYTTAESHLQLAAQALRNRFPSLRLSGSRDAVLPPGMVGRMIEASFQFELDGRQAVGGLQLPFFGCSPWMSPCTLTAFAVWSTLESLERNACTLKAVASSLHCPHGGADGCDDEECNTRCRAKGYQEGVCVDDVCSCAGEAY